MSDTARTISELVRAVLKDDFTHLAPLLDLLEESKDPRGPVIRAGLGNVFADLTIRDDGTLYAVSSHDIYRGLHLLQSTLRRLFWQEIAGDRLQGCFKYFKDIKEGRVS